MENAPRSRPPGADFPGIQAPENGFFGGGVGGSGLANTYSIIIYIYKKERQYSTVQHSTVQYSTVQYIVGRENSNKARAIACIWDRSS